MSECCLSNWEQGREQHAGHRSVVQLQYPSRRLYFHSKSGEWVWFTRHAKWIQATWRYSAQRLSSWHCRVTWARFKSLWCQYCRETYTRWSTKRLWHSGLLNCDQAHDRLYHFTVLKETRFFFKKEIWKDRAGWFRYRQPQSGCVLQGHQICSLKKIRQAWRFFRFWTRARCSTARMQGNLCVPVQTIDPKHLQSGKVWRHGYRKQHDVLTGWHICVRTALYMICAVLLIKNPLWRWMQSTDCKSAQWHASEFSPSGVAGYYATDILWLGFYQLSIRKVSTTL